MYNYPFAVIGEPEDGDVPTYNGTTKQWEAEPGGGGGGTWAQALAAGNDSGGNNPTITAGDLLHFLGSNGNVTAEDSLTVTAGSTDNPESSAGSISLVAGSHMDAGQGGSIILQPGDTTEGGQVGVVAIEGYSIVFGQQFTNPTITQEALASGTGNQLTLIGQESGDDAGGNISIRGGLGDTVGGSIFLVPGESLSGLGGSVEITTGAGVTPGTIKLIHSSDVDPAINVTATGLAFFDGTPAKKPEVTGATVDPVVISLVSALAAMGLITDGTT